MAAHAIALLEDERAELARWCVAAAIVLAAHAGLLATYLMLRTMHSQGVPNVPAVIVDLAPIPVAPESPMDVAPAPEVLEQLPPPEPQVVEQEKVEPVVVEPAPMENPLVALPVEKPQPEVKPEPTLEVKPEEKPTPEVRKKSAAQAAPPKTEHVARIPSIPRAGTASRTNSVNWIAMLMAHLNRHKQYPSAARARRAGHGDRELHCGPQRPRAVAAGRQKLGLVRTRSGGAGDALPRPAAAIVPGGHAGIVAQFQRADPVLGAVTILR